MSARPSYNSAADPGLEPSTSGGSPLPSEPNGSRILAIGHPVSGRLAQRLEHLVYTQGVEGPNPSLPTSHLPRADYSHVSIPRGALSRLQCVTPRNLIGPHFSHASSVHPCSLVYVATPKPPSNTSTSSPSSGSESSTLIHPLLFMRRIIRGGARA